MVPRTQLPSPLKPHHYDGSLVRIAIQEYGNVDFTSNTTQCPSSSNNCFHKGATRAGQAGEDAHATEVGSIAASTNTLFRGVAPGATVYSAGVTGQSDQQDIEALTWALDTQYVEIVNVSYNGCFSDGFTVADRAFDYYARRGNRLIVVAAGNHGPAPNCPSDIVQSPGRGWNVLTVGAYDQTINRMPAPNQFSNWRNPGGGDHEKPEVVAPGVRLNPISRDGQFANQRPENDYKSLTGTSFSAPYVTGLAAVLRQRNGFLVAGPLRAIIMASAINNVDGPRGIPGSTDYQDGAGAVNVGVADATADNERQDITACDTSCWRYRNISNLTPRKGTSLFQYVNAKKGDRIRVVLDWFANPDCATESTCRYDRLDTDFNLTVRGPDQILRAEQVSARVNNNYELVDFIAQADGRYEIEAYRTRDGSEATGDPADAEMSNALSIAIVRVQQVYLPFVRRAESTTSTSDPIGIDDPTPVTNSAPDSSYPAPDSGTGSDSGLTPTATPLGAYPAPDPTATPVPSPTPIPPTPTLAPASDPWGGSKYPCTCDPVY